MEIRNRKRKKNHVSSLAVPFKIDHEISPRGPVKINIEKNKESLR